ncbi:MAG: choice-of-anchor B family protein [Bacteroidota bacterium]|nr:choice-of-anchor B family protein [Bacteroidota bacterium]
MYLLKNLNQHFTNTMYSAVWGYKAPNGREYAMLGCPTGTAFIDITDSADIREVDYLPGLTSSWREMKTYLNYAYIVSEADNSGVQIVDLQYLPDSVHLVKKFVAPTHRSTHAISQSGPYLYLSGCNSSFVPNGGFVVFFLTNDPVTPVVRGKWTTNYVHDCRVVNDTIYAANIYNQKVSVINASNKSLLSSITSFINLPGSGPHNTALSGNGNRLFVIDEIGTAPYKLKVWNIENTSSISYVTSWQPTGITTSIVHNIEIYGNYAIIAHYSAGIRIVNIANPDVPTEVGWYDTYPSNNSESYNGCWGTYMFPSGKIIASDRQTGLYVVKPTFLITGTEQNTTNSLVPDNFSLAQNYPNPFNPATKIKFSLPENSIVSLKIFDINGREVADVLNEKRAAGNYEINFDANKYSLSSGMYYYTLSSGDFKESKKMILIK